MPAMPICHLNTVADCNWEYVVECGERGVVQCCQQTIARRWETCNTSYPPTLPVSGPMYHDVPNTPPQTGAGHKIARCPRSRNENNGQLNHKVLPKSNSQARQNDNR